LAPVQSSAFFPRFNNPKEMSPVQKFFHPRISFSLFLYGLCVFAFKKEILLAFPPDNGQE
jgi:hypothetical protein